MIAQDGAPLAREEKGVAADAPSSRGVGGVVPDALALRALLISRASLYALFHKLLGGVPDEGVLEELLNDSVADMVDEYAEDDVMRGLGAFLRQLGSRDPGELLDAARDEYTRTFIGPAELPAPPTEAPYLTHDAAVFQESTLAVRAWYRKRGMLPRRYLRVPDDHVAIMCCFMARLAEASLDAASDGDAAKLGELLADQQSFATRHLADWLPEYAKALRRSKTAVLYPQSIEALSAFVMADVAFAASASAWLSETNGDGLAACLEEPESFACARETLRRIWALRPFGIEDNELAPEGEVPGHGASQEASAHIGSRLDG